MSLHTEGYHSVSCGAVGNEPEVVGNGSLQDSERHFEFPGPEVTRFEAANLVFPQNFCVETNPSRCACNMLPPSSCLGEKKRR